MSGTIRLGKYLSIDKDSLISIEPDKRYTIAGVQNYGKGVVNKRVVKGSELTMKKYQVIKRNQLMWCKVDTKNGAFGITKEEHEGSLASTNMCLANIDTIYLNPDFLQLLFTNGWFYNSITAKSTGTTNRQYLTPPQLFELVEIPDFDVDKQKNFLKRYRSLKDSGLFEVIHQQQTYLQRLRQTILQEAVQGKLTKQDPTDEPATELLKRIKDEKQKLIKTGKLKKEKELPLITENEIPFELPKDWVWCKIDSLILNESKDLRTGPFGSSLNKSEHKKQGVPVLGIESISKQGEFLGKNKIFVTTDKAEELKSFYVKGGDLILSRSGTIGELCVLPDDIKPSLISTNLLKISLNTNIINSTYFCHVIKGSNHIAESLSDFCGGTTRLFITQTILKKLIFPLPPLAEQQRIVAKVQQLQQQLSQLEAQVQQSRQYALQLLQTVLKDAFEQKGKIYDMADEVLSAVAEK